MDWISATVADTAPIAIAADTSFLTYIALPSTIQTLFTDPTLIRIRGKIDLSATVVGNAHGAIGIYPWADVNDTVPIAGEGPLPWSAPSMDWIWWDYYSSSDGTGVFTRSPTRSGSVGDGGVGPIEVDSKAMRRLGSDKGILLVVQNVGVAVQLYFGLRLLIKE